MSWAERLITLQPTLRRRATQELLRDAPKLALRSEAAWSREMVNTSHSPQMRRKVHYAQCWGALMQLEIQECGREVLPTVALQLAKDVGLCNIKNPFMFSAAVDILYDHWIYGDDIMDWYRTLETR